jgi:hypothetical protein
MQGHQNYTTKCFEGELNPNPWMDSTNKQLKADLHKIQNLLQVEIN